MTAADLAARLVLDRYRVVRRGARWHVVCGTGTRSLGRFWRRTAALRLAIELTTAFFDGQYMALRSRGLA